MTFDALARLDANNSFSQVIGVCRLIDRTRKQYAEHEQARRKCHHDSPEKPVIRFHSHTTRPSFPPLSSLANARDADACSPTPPCAPRSLQARRENLSASEGHPASGEPSRRS